MNEINLYLEVFARLLMDDQKLFEDLEGNRYWAEKPRSENHQVLLELDQLSSDQITCQGMDYFDRFGRCGVIISI